MAIEFKDVSFAYPNGYVANEHLDLVIRDGETLAIVGQNGAGKTTAVKLMNGSGGRDQYQGKKLRSAFAYSGLCVSESGRSDIQQYGVSGD